MTGKEFMRAVANGETDIVQVLLEIFAQAKTSYCVIGGLAVNAYVEPVVSLDLDIVVVTENIELVCTRAEEQGLRIDRFSHSINLSSARSDLRIQMQTDIRYQDFIRRASKRTVLGYDLMVAQLEDVFQGKIWAYSDETRRKSKRQKDLADITRLFESFPHLMEVLPESIRKVVA